MARRWPWLLGGTTIFSALLAAWTVRAAWPDRHEEDAVGDHFLPLSGDKLFVLIGGPEGRYDVRSEGVRCDREVVNVDEELRCGSDRLFVRDINGRHRLVLEGVSVALPGVVGSGRDVDALFPLPGMGSRQLEWLPVDECPIGETPETPVACLRNGGASGTLVVDRAARQSETAPLAKTRVGLAQGEAILVDERDLVWVGQVPLRIRRKEGLILLSVPEETWTTLAGDRRWMALELPWWPLAKAANIEPEKHVFWSRESLFNTPAWPFHWRTHLQDSRVEYEQEELFQSFIDHELLCLAPDARSLTWNLRTGIGCDGSAAPAPPTELWRDAEQAAYRPGTKRILEVTAESLSGLPEHTPDPAGMVFVFDWAFELNADGELYRVPVRLLGVRPGSTRNGPPEAPPRYDGTDACALAKAGVGTPPIDVTAGSTSAYLEVVEDGPLTEGTTLVIPGSRGSAKGPVAALCAWTGSKVPANAGKFDAAASSKLSGLREVVSLGQLHVRGESKGGTTLFWSAAPQATVPNGAEGACAALVHADDGWTLLASGDANQIRVGEALAETARIPLADGARVRIGSGKNLLDLVFHDPVSPDHAAYSEVQAGHVERRYPFGALASPIIGYGPLAGGLEGAGSPELWKQANQAWRDAACKDAAAPAGISLTLRGDLQRIVAGEVAAMGEACASGDPRCTPKGDGVTASAVLLDSKTGDVLAVGNWPSFDPQNPDQTEALRRSLRLAGPGGTITVPDLENKAFLRARNAGSAYKLATAYTLGREGWLTDPPKANDSAFACKRFTWYAPRAGSADPVLLAPGYAPNGPRSQPCGHHAVNLTDANAGFHDAFRYSINLYFGLVPFAVLPDSGVRYERPHVVGSLADPLANPLGGESGLWVYNHEGSADLGITLAADFDVAHDIAPNNPFLTTLLGLGHRYHYPKVGGGTYYTQYADGVGDTVFPTAASPWLPGLVVGSGFRYPSMVGPEAYAVEGVPGWSERDVVLSIRDTVPSTQAIRVGTSSIREYSRVGYGMGGVEASALSLAVMGSPMARIDGGVVTPKLIQSPAQPAAAPVTPGFVSQGRAAIESAMRAVVNEPGSTAAGWFSDDVAKRIGGKTGTFEIARRVSDVAFSDPTTWKSIETIGRYGCGVRGVTPDAQDWTRLAAAVDKRKGRYKKRLDERPWLLPTLATVVNAPPARGFAASADVCTEWQLNPSRAQVGIPLGDVDGGLWLDALFGLFPRDDNDEELVEGSSFVAVMFDGLVDAATPGAPPLGQGWVLAVVVDGHPTGGKRTASRILDRLRQQLLVEQAVGIANPN